MAQPTYSARGIVLRKTKLGEMDLIVTLLAEDGSQLRAVAKGARKPGGAFAGKLELCNTVDVLCSKGRSLDSIREARLVRSHPQLMMDPARAAYAMCVAELVERVTQEGLSHDRLFNLVEAALSAVAQAREAQAAYVCAAALLKVFAFTGIMPRFTQCASCGAALPADAPHAFSVREGGVLCAACAADAQTHPLGPATAQLADSLLRATFASILESGADAAAVQRVLELCRDWSRFHIGSRLRSLDLLLETTAFPV